jgi:hypothetical protein
VAFAVTMSSSSISLVTLDNIGPKISSRVMPMSLVTLATPFPNEVAFLDSDGFAIAGDDQCRTLLPTTLNEMLYAVKLGAAD